MSVANVDVVVFVGIAVDERGPLLKPAAQLADETAVGKLLRDGLRRPNVGADFKFGAYLRLASEGRMAGRRAVGRRGQEQFGLICIVGVEHGRGQHPIPGRRLFL